MLTLLKFSTHDCHACQSMVGVDSRVAAELGLAFVDVNMKDTALYKRFRHILLQQHPSRSSLALPTYLLVSDPDGQALVHAEIVGAMPEQEFRSRIQGLIPEATQVRASAAPAGPGD